MKFERFTMAAAIVTTTLLASALSVMSSPAAGAAVATPVITEVALLASGTDSGPGNANPNFHRVRVRWAPVDATVASYQIWWKPSGGS